MHERDTFTNWEMFSRQHLKLKEEACGRLGFDLAATLLKSHENQLP